MKIENDIKLDFKDVLLRPKRSTLNSRSEVNLEREITFVNSGATWKGVPIMSTNMDTIGNFDMYRSLSKYKMLTCFHKYVPNIPHEFDPNYYIISTGITDRDLERLSDQIEHLRSGGVEPKFICVDVANGYMTKLKDFCLNLRSLYPNITIIAGNVVTREIVEELILNAKVDVVKVGIGSGSVCTTRLLTGVGMPQLSAVMECSDAAHGLDGHIISDGGAVVPGDLSKAFGGGGDFVMLGSMLSGHDECEGELIEEDGKQYKKFYGMSSDTAMKKYHGGVAKYRASEGKTVKIPYRGPVSNTVDSMLGGIRSTCTYVGARRLKDLPKCTTFMMVNNQVNTVYNGLETK